MTPGAVKAGVVIVGAGQAGAQVAVSLRDGGYAGPVTLIGDEPVLPYQRPPLSKAYLLGKLDAIALHLRAGSFFEEKVIDVLHGHRIAAIDREERCVRFETGQHLSYEHLVLATGTRNRKLPVPGCDLGHVFSLRSLHDATVLRAGMVASQVEGRRRAVVVGAGFIGMEFAAVASSLGLEVTVIEAGTRALARSCSPTISDWLQGRHAARGVTFLFGAGVSALHGTNGQVSGITLSDGRQVPAELVLVAVGVVPNAELAQAAGLPVNDGIVVDQHLLTKDPAISAIGDCANAPSVHAPGLLRLESVQNATDQAKTVAARLLGRPAPYSNVPWFWSDQGPDKLQIAGLAGAGTRTLWTGDETAGRFSVLSFREDRFVGAESINRPTDHMAARRLLGGGTVLTFDQAAQPGFDLPAFVSASKAAA